MNPDRLPHLLSMAEIAAAFRRLGVAIYTAAVLCLLLAASDHFLVLGRSILPESDRP